MLVEEIKKLNAVLGIPKSLSEVGVKEEAIENMAKDAMKTVNVLVNPRKSTLKDIIELYKKAL
jgi:alcohol dehydrogenase